MTTAPGKFAAWLASYKKVDKFGRSYSYHPRSDAHSIELCNLVLEDLLDACPLLREHGESKRVAYGINIEHVWAGGKKKTLDLAIGQPRILSSRPSRITALPQATEFIDVLLACEAKSVMTEHGKAQPRVFDELSSSHEIVHKGRVDAIAAGMAVVNIATSFVSPTRNQSADGIVYVSKHKQPHVTEKMVKHLNGLVVRETLEDVGFDAYCTIVVDCDNQGHARLHTGPPAPQPGDRDHYETFISRLSRYYVERFSNLV